MWRQRPPRRGHDGTVRGPGLRGRHGAGAAEAPLGHRVPGAGAPAAGVSSGEAAGGGRRGPEARPGDASGAPRAARAAPPGARRGQASVPALLVLGLLFASGSPRSRSYGFGSPEAIFLNAQRAVVTWLGCSEGRERAACRGRWHSSAWCSTAFISPVTIMLNMSSVLFLA